MSLERAKYPYKVALVRSEAGFLEQRECLRNGLAFHQTIEKVHDSLNDDDCVDCVDCFEEHWRAHCMQVFSEILK